MLFVAFWYRYISEQLQIFTYTMWKYIIIAAVVLFLGACFLFYKTNDALTGPEGEVAAVQSQFDMARKKVVDIEKDKAIKRYAELRMAYFKQQSDKYNEERAAIEAEDAPFDQEIAKANADLETAAADFKKYNEELLLNKIAPTDKGQTREKKYRACLDMLGGKYGQQSNIITG